MKKTGLFLDETLFLYTYIAHNGLIFKTCAPSLDICRKLRDRWQRHLSVSFTGHRHITDYKLISERLKSTIKLSYDMGIRFFYAGGAVGFDILAAENVLNLKSEFLDMVLIVVVPFPEQYKFFNGDNKKRYFNILDKADEVITISEKYTNIAYLKRNDYMVSHSNQLIAFWDRKSKGGTSYTIKKAERGKRIIYNLYK